MDIFLGSAQLFFFLLFFFLGGGGEEGGHLYYIYTFQGFFLRSRFRIGIFLGGAIC